MSAWGWDHMRELVILAAVFAITATAWAADPACETPAADQSTWQCEGGSCCYCSPGESDTGRTYPETGYPMTCDVLIDGVPYLQTPDVGPLERICIGEGTYRFAHTAELSCSNSFGQGAALVVDASFRGTPPGRPALSGD